MGHKIQLAILYIITGDCERQLFWTTSKESVDKCEDRVTSDDQVMDIEPGHKDGRHVYAVMEWSKAADVPESIKGLKNQTVQCMGTAIDSVKGPTRVNGPTRVRVYIIYKNIKYTDVTNNTKNNTKYELWKFDI